MHLIFIAVESKSLVVLNCGLGLFLSLGLAGAIPTFHCLLFTDLFRIAGFPLWLFFMGICYLIGGVAYATRIPECLWPGKFDIWVSILTTVWHQWRLVN